MFGQPALVSRHDRGDAQGVTLLAQQGVAAVAGAVGPDLAALREVDDVLDVVAGPRHVGLARLQRRADRVQGRDEEAVVAQHVEGALAHPGHHPHRDGDIGAVGDLDAQGGDLGPERTHAERHHVHGAAAHRPFEELFQVGPHFLGLEPVVGRTGVGRILGADEGAAFDAGDVAGVGRGVEAVGALGRVQGLQGAGLDQFGGEEVPLLVRTVAPVDPVRLRQFRDLAYPRQEFCMFGRGLVETRNGQAHQAAPLLFTHAFVAGPAGSLTDPVHRASGFGDMYEF